MTHLMSLTVTALLDAIASSSQPVPAGGSAAALAGAAGTSLLLMAATLPKTRSGSAAEAAALMEEAHSLRPLREVLMGLVDRDRDAYAALLDAVRLPRTTAAQQASRLTAVADAARVATEVPLETMRASRQALGSAVRTAGQASGVVRGDVAVGVELLAAAVRGAGLSVESNLAGMQDAEYVARVRAECRRLEEESAADVQRARAAAGFARDRST
jgi:glutamate formiminotransferase/formiminotetrahydrofolate cyclodeaminase